MTGEMIFVMLIIGVVCIVGIYISKIHEKESKQKGMEKKIEIEVSIHTENSNQQKKKEVEELRKRLLETEQGLWEVESKNGYEKFFHKVVMPLQILLGLSKVSFDTLEEERVVYYVWEVIGNPLIMAAEQMKGTIKDGKLTLSLSRETFDLERAKKDIHHFGKVQLEDYIKENERRLELGEIVFQKVGVVQGLGELLEELKELEKNRRIEENVVHGLAQKLWQLFEANRIYPMFADDRRLASYPDLRKRFIPLNQHSIRYPGLFIEREGMLEVFGSNIGMDNSEI